MTEKLSAVGGSTIFLKGVAGTAKESRNPTTAITANGEVQTNDEGVPSKRSGCFGMGEPMAVGDGYATDKARTLDSRLQTVSRLTRLAWYRSQLHEIVRAALNARVTDAVGPQSCERMSIQRGRG